MRWASCQRPEHRPGIPSGEIPPDQGKALIDSVVSMARVIEVAELEQQLTELRELLEGRS